MTPFAPDPTILANLDQYVSVVQYAIKRELTSAEIVKAADMRAHKRSPWQLAEELSLSSSSPSLPLSPVTEGSPGTAMKPGSGDPLLIEMETLL